MADLALSYDDIRKRVGYERGYGMTIADWADNGDAVTIIENCLRDGANMFYTQAGYEWSFLTPLASMTIKDNSNEMDLPADFNFLVDDIYFDDNSGCTLKIRSDGEVLWKRQQDSTSTGKPTIAAVVADGGPTVNHGQTSKLIFWPTADIDYDVQVRYSLNPMALGAKTPYPYGGAAHAQTFLEACLAASEKMDGVVGRHTQDYPIVLEASKMHDRRLKPRTLGYNGNGTDRRGRLVIRPTTVTYNP